MVEIIEDVIYQAATPTGFVDVDARKGERLSLAKEAEKALVGMGAAKAVPATRAKK